MSAMSEMSERGRVFCLDQQSGAALVIAVLILLVLTVIGIFAITTSMFETKIAGFEREFKEAFYTADSGEPIGIDVIKKVIHYVPTSPSNLSTLSADPLWNNILKDNLFNNNEIFTDGRNTDDPISAPNILATGQQIGFPSSSPTRLRADIDRLSSYQITGGAQQFAAGYEGIGSGGGGSVGIIYEIDSVGRYTHTNAQSEIEAGYRHVVGVSGGH